MPTSPDIQIEVFGKTDVGLIREHNEDNFLIADVTAGIRSSNFAECQKMDLGDKGVALLVCDGMGGAAAGEVAAQMAVDVVYEALAMAPPLPRDGFARALRRAVETANDAIFVQSRDNQSERGMGTTCTVAALNDSTLVVAQIGDSRCYVLRQGRLSQVTKDQSLAWQLIEAGAMTAEEAKAFEHANIILQALGVQDQVEVVLSQVGLRQGDVVLLCSDGLHGPVADDEILEVLTTEGDLKRAGDALIQKALDRDGPDNVTVVLARFGGPGLPAPEPDDVVTFVGYDPGPDPGSDVPTPLAPLAPSTGVSTVQERIPPELLHHSEEVVTKSDGQRRAEITGPGPIGAPPPQTMRSVLALLFLALVAAAVGGISVMKCERDRTSSASETRGGGP
ncbi:MAG TPA: protein phosphatase 2C domain-containing protein [Polyangia bacterium]|nr:protein phosphatase 2C domain-containing protein [Polyangia bacterium]